ncbi:hypothetical protein [Maribacter sp. R77961]|uniref:hypothetical protein n=1 Tax=Maribacter sp. R77961 TaxID=3093871 RepID=UPI0037CBB936
MKTTHFFFLLLAIAIYSCGENNDENSNEYGYNQQFANENGQNTQKMNNQAAQNVFRQHGNGQSYANRQSSNGKKVFELKDPQGKTIGTYPIPKNWKKGSGDAWLESNDGVKVMNDVTNEFNYSHMPDYNQMMRENKQQVKPVKSLERFIKEDLVQMTQSQGIKLVNIQRTPAITKLNAERSKMWFKAMPEQMNFDSAIVDFVDAEGNPSFLLVTYYVGSSQYQKRWGYTISGVEAPRAIYQQAKQDFMYAVLNSKLNQQYVQQINMQNQQASQQSTAAHNSRMEQIRNFGANNTKLFNARSAAFDSRHNSWRADQMASDRMHQKTINSINEVDTWSDGSGGTFEVDGYYNKVYTNGIGEYMGTDDVNYDPNLDPSVNGDWQEAEPIDNGWNY